MQLDHVFAFVRPDSPEFAHLAALGLVETYRRRHLGQGTANACFCFDNLFLELLWVCDQEEINSEAVLRTGLSQRARWITEATCPFGIAWRNEPEDTTSIRTWDYRPPYLPDGISIDVATDGDDVQQPMMFRSPGSAPPIDWPADRRGALQHRAGLTRVLHVELAMPPTVAPSPALISIAQSTILSLATAHDACYSKTIMVEHGNASAPLRIGLPIGSP
jgi:hypothetical protein